MLQGPLQNSLCMVLLASERRELAYLRICNRWDLVLRMIPTHKYDHRVETLLL